MWWRNARGLAEFWARRWVAASGLFLYRSQLQQLTATAELLPGACLSAPHARGLSPRQSTVNQKVCGVKMHNRSFSLVSFAGVLILAMACSGDNPSGPGSPAQLNPNTPVSNQIKADLAAEGGNAIASNLEELAARSW